MISAIESEAELISVNGGEAGRALWSGIECAMQAGLPGSKARRVFDILVEQITEDMNEFEAPLFAASAFEALPLAATSTQERAVINSAAWSAYDSYCREAEAREIDQNADFAFEQARDERMMGAE